MTVALAVAGSLAISLGLNLALMRRTWPGFLDRPNLRSLHSRPIPKTGGIAMVAAILAVGNVRGGSLTVLIAIALALAAVSLADDVNGVPLLLRLLAHATGAGALCVWALSDQLLICAIVVLCVVWATNLFNFMDGMDGLAGGMALVGFGTYAAVAWVAGDHQVGLLCLVISAAAVGFLAFNFPPARIFLGDVGSIPVGFLAAAVGVVGWNRGLWPAWFPVVLFGPFVVDATFTLARRALRRERIWEAHCEHYYQRIVHLGWSQRRVVCLEYALMGISAVVACSARSAGSAVTVVLLPSLAALYAVLMAMVDARWSRACRAHGGSGLAPPHLSRSESKRSSFAAGPGGS